MAEAFNIPVRPHATLGPISFVMFARFRGFGPGDDDAPELPQASSALLGYCPPTPDVKATIGLIRRKRLQMSGIVIHEAGKSLLDRSSLQRE